MDVRAVVAAYSRALGAPPSRRAVAALSIWLGLVIVVGLFAAAVSFPPPVSHPDVAVGVALAAEPIVAAAPTATAIPETTTTTTVPATLPLPAPTPSTTTIVAVPDPSPPPPPTTAAPPPSDPPPPAPAPSAAGVDAAAEQQLLEDHNSRRASEGLPPLQRHPCLDAIARDWSAGMATSASLRHNPGYADAIAGCVDWRAVGENVGCASAGELAGLFWGSSRHRANIVGAYQYVGIGVVVDADGMRWATLDFASV